MDDTAGPAGDGKPLRMPALLRRLPESLKWSFFVWLIARVIYSAWGAFLWAQGLTHTQMASSFYHEIQPVLAGPWGALVGVWQRWDAIHYIRIAQNGYDAVDLTAFFPLYPWLGGLLSRLTGMDTTVSLLIVSNLAFLLALVLLFQIVEEIFPDRRPGLARGTIIAAALFPASVFFLAPYPQSLALLLVLFSYLSALRNRWLPALAGGVAAGLCHSTILALAILLAWEAVRFIRTSGGRLRWVALLVSAGPFLGTGLFLAWRVSRGFPSFTQLLEFEWGRVSQWPWLALARLPEIFTADYLANSGWLNIALLGLAVGVFVWGIRRLPPGQVIYFGILLISIISMDVASEVLSSFSRYLLLAFQLFIGLAAMASRRAVRLAFIFAGVLTVMYVSALYFMWAWVA